VFVCHYQKVRGVRRVFRGPGNYKVLVLREGEKVRASWTDPPPNQPLRQHLKNEFVGRVLAIVRTKRNDSYRGPWLDSTSAVCY